MRYIDLGVIVVYLIGITWFGARFRSSQHSLRDYFLGGQTSPWWAIAFTIVSAETSTLTVIGTPAISFGGNFGFLQVVLGYLLARIVISILFLPHYFKGDLFTAYELMQRRFGVRLRKLTAGLFLVLRALAEGVRVFAISIVISVVLGTGEVASIAVILGLTLFYTFHGGMTAVIWTDVVQLVVYLLGAAVAVVVLLDRIPGGWAEVVEVGSAAGRFQVFDFTWDVTRSYTFWSGVIGGAFLTTATHGTDQLMVQRYLCSASARQARLALLTSGVVVFAQFVLFLLIGAMLYAYYTGQAPAEAAAFTVDGRLRTDRIFPAFIVSHMPPGLVGLVCAAVFAAAMSTLSSSLNSSSAATMADFYMPFTAGRTSAEHDLRASRWFTAGWGVLQIGVALVAVHLSSRVVDEVLGIASFTNGVILGVFLLGTFAPRVRQRSACAGMATGALVVLAVKLVTGVSWQWYVLIGSVTTYLAGWSAARLGVDRGAAAGPTGL
jgi:SSS family solute:Na+ symporter